MVESRKAHIPRVWLLCTSFREAEVVPLSLQTAWLLFMVDFLPYTPDLMVNFLLYPVGLCGIFFLLSQHTLILNARPETS